MRMARVNVYLPDDLADEVRAADINVSAVSQAALREALAARQVDAWLDEVGRLPSAGVAQTQVQAAVAAAKDELEGG
jgi:post-segregation antitoxin (ccd killing protein)